MTDLKAMITRDLRCNALRAWDETIWSRGGSRRYLWSPEDVAAAIRYALEEQ